VKQGNQNHMANDVVSRFFGGPPLAVLAKLVLLSIVVGVILSAVGLEPWNILHSIERLIRNVWDMGFEAVRWPAKAQSRINALIRTTYPADISCLQAVAAAGSNAGAQAVSNSDKDCQVADNSSIPTTFQSMLG